MRQYILFFNAYTIIKLSIFLLTKVQIKQVRLFYWANMNSGNCASENFIVSMFKEKENLKDDTKCLNKEELSRKK
jgi:hypothetical protein